MFGYVVLWLVYTFYILNGLRKVSRIAFLNNARTRHTISLSAAGACSPRNISHPSGEINSFSVERRWAGFTRWLVSQWLTLHFPGHHWMSKARRLSGSHPLVPRSLQAVRSWNSSRPFSHWWSICSRGLWGMRISSLHRRCHSSTA